MAKANSSNPLKVVTGEVRLSFVHLFEPYAAKPDQQEKYSCLILIPKTDTATLARIEAAQQAAIEAGKSSKWNGKVPPNLTITLHDGDTEQDLDDYPEFAGHMFMNVSANLDYPPGVVDRKLNPIDDRSAVYSGCYARVSLMAYPFNAQGNRGVSFGLRNVQKLRDGEPLGGTSRAEDDFDAVDDDEADDLI